VVYTHIREIYLYDLAVVGGGGGFNAAHPYQW
jgi:hypothetical protein